MKSFVDYVKSVFTGLWTLLTGMKITLTEFFTPKVTQCYPENRATLKVSDRFRGTLTLKQDEEGNHKCIACGLCAINCPNQTITIKTRTITTEEGKTKKVLDKYIYDLGSCTFCQLCVSSCPHNAIEFSPEFEHAVYTREKLVKQLNKK
ncbi:MAG: 4Fe-4S binding protein [Bacteroidetes bacterium]|uniref:4Fe-4S binding protein n=1 Tax=Candidatus Caccoplasma merdipullorum TaxID=2840718 RepID=A0A9D9E405_9BACT|nr:4Fe-4S binding protein [Candidatus Caccoplasma merdipullorum]